MNVPIAIPDASGTRLRIWVVPGANRPGLVGLHGNALKVRVASPAERDRANRELCSLVEEHFECEVTLVGGHRSRAKVVLLHGLRPEEVAARLPP